MLTISVSPSVTLRLNTSSDFFVLLPCSSVILVFSPIHHGINSDEVTVLMELITVRYETLFFYDCCLAIWSFSYFLCCSIYNLSWSSITGSPRCAGYRPLCVMRVELCVQPHAWSDAVATRSFCALTGTTHCACGCVVWSSSDRQVFCRATSIDIFCVFFLFASISCSIILHFTLYRLLSINN